MPKTFRPRQPEQATLLPPSPSDWLRGDHSGVLPAQSKDPRGERYGKGMLGSDLPDDPRRRQDRLARIRQARKEMETEAAAAAEQAELKRKVETAEAKANAAREKAI